MSLFETTIPPKPGLKNSGQISKTMGYYAAFVGLGLVMASLGPLLPDLAEQTRSGLSQVSFLFTARSLGYLLGSFLGGRLYDRVSGHPLMALVLFAMAGLLTLIPLMPLLWSLVVILILLGWAMGTLDVGGNTLLVWVHRDRVGPFMNGLHFFFGVGAFLSPIVIAQAVLVSGQIIWAYWVLALLVVPIAVWLLNLTSPLRQTIRDDGVDKPINYGVVALIALFFAGYAGAEAAFGGWIFTYAVELKLANEAAAAYLTSGFWGALTAGRLLAIPMVAYFRPRFILISALGGCLASIGLMLVGPDSLAVIWAGTLGLGFSMAAVFPTTLALAERHMTVTGQVTGWFFVGASSGGMSLPWFIGQLFEAVGPAALIWTIAVDVVVAVGIFVVLMMCITRAATSKI